MTSEEYKKLSLQEFDRAAENLMMMIRASIICAARIILTFWRRQ